MSKASEKRKAAAEHLGADPFQIRKVRTSRPPTQHLPMTNLRLLRLPRELRDEIYDYAWRGTRIPFQHYALFPGGNVEAFGVACYGGKGSSKGPDIFKVPSWLQADSRISEEGLQQFYRRTDFLILSVGMLTSTFQGNIDQKPTANWTVGIDESRSSTGIFLHHAQIVKMLHVPAFYPRSWNSPELSWDLAPAEAYLLRSLQCRSSALQELEIGLWNLNVASSAWKLSSDLYFFDAIPRRLRSFKISFQEEAEIDNALLDGNIREKVLKECARVAREVVRDGDGVDGRVHEWSERLANGTPFWRCEASSPSYTKCR